MTQRDVAALFTAGHTRSPNSVSKQTCSTNHHVPGLKAPQPPSPILVQADLVLGPGSFMGSPPALADNGQPQAHRHSAGGRREMELGHFSFSLVMRVMLAELAAGPRVET